MRQILLGRTNVRVSAVSLGTWSYGGPNQSGTIPVGWAHQRDADSRAALHRAWELGINHWDTADVYGDGHSETIIGSMWETVPREDIFLASKVGWDSGPYDHYYHPQLMEDHLERSLRNLRTDVIDLYYLHHCHFGEQDEYFADAVEQMRRFHEAGKIRFIGLSDWNLNLIMRYIDRVDPDVVQPYRNVMDDTYTSSGLKSWIETHNRGVAFFSPLKHGLLTGKYTQPATFPEGDFRANVKEFGDPEVITKMQVNRKTLETHFADHPQPVLHGLIDALLADAPTGCVLLGQRNVQQVEAAATLGDALSPAEAEWVKKLYH